jgi:uncharacterized protein (TIGR03437 family)
MRSKRSAGLPRFGAALRLHLVVSQTARHLRARIRLAGHLAAALVLCACCASGQALNSASFWVQGVAGAGVAQGSIFVLFGTFLGPGTLQQADSLPLKTSLGGTSVRVVVGSVAVDAFIVYTSDAQVAAVLPSGTPTGDGQVTVKYNGRNSNAIAIHVVATSFGIYTRSANGAGPGVIQNYDAQGNAVLNSYDHPAIPGQTGVIWGTGLGPISGYDGGPPPVGSLSAAVSVIVGGKTATVQYSGRSASFPGVDQINFTVPDGVTGCQVPVVVKAEDHVSNYVSMAVSPDGSACSDATSISAADVATAVRNGTSKLGFMAISRVSFTNNPFLTDYTIEEGQAQFRKRSSAALLAQRGLWLAVPAPGTCTANVFRLTSSNQTALDPGDPLDLTLLNAGATVVVSGPRGSLSLNRQSWGGYLGTLGGGAPGNAILAPFLDLTGTYLTAGGRSGVDIGSYQGSLTLPVSITWSGVSSTTVVPLSTALTVTWTGGDMDKEVVVLRGASTNSSAGIRGVFTCVATVDAEELTVPVEVLAAIPGSDAQGGLLEVGTMTRMDKARFTAPGLDGGYFFAWRTTRIPVTYQ